MSLLGANRRAMRSSRKGLRGYTPCGALAGQAQPQALDEFGIALGTLDDDPGIRPESHIFVCSKAPWFEITDNLPQYEGYPPRIAASPPARNKG
jgi:hypothetical protein